MKQLYCTVEASSISHTSISFVYSTRKSPLHDRRALLIEGSMWRFLLYHVCVISDSPSFVVYSHPSSIQCPSRSVWYVPFLPHRHLMPLFHLPSATRADHMYVDFTCLHSEGSVSGLRLPCPRQRAFVRRCSATQLVTETKTTNRCCWRLRCERFKSLAQYCTV